MLLYNGRYNDRNDFIALELIDGRLQFSYSLGANVTRVALDSHPQSLSDGDWHTVTVHYVNRVRIKEDFSFFLKNRLIVIVGDNRRRF